MKFKSNILLYCFTIIFCVLLISCSSNKNIQREIIGELKINSPISTDFSKFSGTESYTFTLEEPTLFEIDLTLRTGKTSISLKDESGNEYLSLNSSEKNKITITPDSKTNYFLDLTYDNGVGSYSISITN